MLRTTFDIFMAIIGVIVLALIIMILSGSYRSYYSGQPYYSVQSYGMQQPVVQVNPPVYYTTR